jgi:glycosyltransferase involved in cell wall biosynthesis
MLGALRAKLLSVETCEKMSTKEEKDGCNGYVIPEGDPTTLESRLRELLADPEKRRRMGQKGYVRAHSELDEKMYAKKFAEMVEATVRDDQ